MHAPSPRTSWLRNPFSGRIGISACKTSPKKTNLFFLFGMVKKKEEKPKSDPNRADIQDKTEQKKRTTR